MIGDKWAQLLPYYYNDVDTRIYSTSVFWFYRTGGHAPAFADILPMEIAFQAWLDLTIANLVTWPVAAVMDASLYWGDGAYANQVHTIFGSNIVRQGDPLPVRKCVVLRKLKRPIPYAVQGRSFISNVGRDEVDGNLLTPAAVTRWTPFVNSMTSGVPASGGIYHMIVPLQFDPFIYNITDMRIDRKLGNRLHRTKAYRLGTGYTSPIPRPL